MKKCDFAWGFEKNEKKDSKDSKKEDSNADKNSENSAVIKKMDLDLKPRDLLVVIGSVGSGKTTLLNSVLEETELTSG